MTWQILMILSIEVTLTCWILMRKYKNILAFSLIFEHWWYGKLKVPQGPGRCPAVREFIWLSPGRCGCNFESVFLHTKLWILGVEKRHSRLLFTFASICTSKNNRRTWHHNACISRSCDVNCGDVTMLSQKRPSLATMVKWTTDDCF